MSNNLDLGPAFVRCYVENSSHYFVHHCYYVSYHKTSIKVLRPSSLGGGGGGVMKGC